MSHNLIMARFYKKKSYSSRANKKYAASRSARSSKITSRRTGMSTRRTKGTFKSYKRRGRRTQRIKVRVPTNTVNEGYSSTKGKSRKVPGATNTWTQSPSGIQITAQSGRQNYQRFSLCDYSGLTTALSTTGDAPGNTSGSNNDTKNIFWRSAMKQLMFTNSGNAPTNIELHHYVVRRDTSISLEQAWNAGMQDAQGSVTDNRLVYGMQPYSNPVVPRYFKLKKITDITLGPGATYKHTHKINMNRTISNEVLANDVNPNINYAGITQVLFAIVKGYPGTDSFTPSLVNTTPAKVNVTFVDTYRYTFITDNTANNSVAAGTGMAGIGGNVLVYDANGNAGNSETAIGI